MLLSDLIKLSLPTATVTMELLNVLRTNLTWHVTSETHKDSYRLL